MVSSGEWESSFVCDVSRRSAKHLSICVFSLFYITVSTISAAVNSIFFSFFLHYFITELKTDQRITKIISSIINKGNNQLQLWGCCLGDTWWENSNACHITPWRSDSRAGGVWAERGRWWVGAEVELRSKKYKKRKQPLSIPRPSWGHGSLSPSLMTACSTSQRLTSSLPAHIVHYLIHISPTALCLSLSRSFFVSREHFICCNSVCRCLTARSELRSILI